MISRCVSTINLNPAATPPGSNKGCDVIKCAGRIELIELLSILIKMMREKRDDEKVMMGPSF